MALLPVIPSSLRTAFSKEKEEGRPIGAVFASVIALVFASVIAAANTQCLGVGAAFWALCLAPAYLRALQDTPPTKLRP